MVHWKLVQDTKVSFELLLSVKAVHEVREEHKIVTLFAKTVGEDEINMNVEPFEETTDKIISLEVEKGEVVLAPEKVRRHLVKLAVRAFVIFLTCLSSPPCSTAKHA